MGKRRYLILKMYKKDPLCSHIRHIVFRRRRGFNILIIGPTQCGKSTIALTLAIKLYKEFSLQNDCAIIGTLDFQDKLTSNVKRGCVKLMDEIGVAMDHHLWWNSLQMATSDMFKTHGFEGKIIIATSPTAEQINKDVRELFDIVIEVNENSMDWDNHIVRAEVYKRQTNQMTGKQYNSYVRGRYEDKSVKQIRNYTFPFPPKRLWDEYKNLSDTRKLDRQIEKLNASRMEVMKTQSKDFSPMTFAEEIAKDPEKFISIYKNRKFIDLIKIKNNFAGIGNDRAKMIRTAACEKLNMPLDGIRTDIIS